MTISPLFSFRQQLLKLYFSHLCRLRHKLKLCRCCHCKYPKFRCFYMVLSKHFLHWALFHFNPLTPCGGRRRKIRILLIVQQYFNPLPPCEGRHSPSFQNQIERISIHSLRVEGDMQQNISVTTDGLFQSTPSVWRETSQTLPKGNGRHGFQSTPSVWRETSSWTT